MLRHLAKLLSLALLLVIATSGLAGHYASEGMTLVQWAGAMAAVLGSITVAVAVRVWEPATARVRQGD